MPNVIFCDSFDHYAVADIAKKGYTYIGSSVAIQNTGRTGNGYHCANQGTNSELNLPIPGGPKTTIYIEFALSLGSLSSATYFLALFDETTEQIEVKPTVAGELQIVRGGSTQIGVTSGLALTINTWYHIGFMVTFHDTAGVYDLRVDGVSKVSSTTADTKQSANNTANMIFFRSPSSLTKIDDIIISTDGFCGDCTVACLFPVANGFFNEWHLQPYSYGYSLGMGNRDPMIQVTKVGGLWTGGALPSVLVDGDYTAGSVLMFNASVIGSALKFDFGSGASRIIQEVTMYTNMNSSSMGTWQWQGSNDDSGWTNIGATFITAFDATGKMVITTLAGNTTGYRYYRMNGSSGNGNVTGQIREFEFKIDPSGTPPSNYQMVDEAVMDGDLTYLYSASPGEAQTFDYQPLGLIGNIKAVQHVATARKDDSGSRIIQFMSKSGAIPNFGVGRSLQDTYVMHKDCMAVNPSGGLSWTVANLDATEFGIKFFVPTLREVIEARGKGEIEK